MSRQRRITPTRQVPNKLCYAPSQKIIRRILKESSNKRIKHYVQEGLSSIEQLEKDLAGVGANNQYTNQDFAFVESFEEPGKNKSWKKIFGKGKAKGLFKSYKLPATLKSSYYHVKRRQKQKYKYMSYIFDFTSLLLLHRLKTYSLGVWIASNYEFLAV